MTYVKSLTSVQRADFDSAGVIGSDLALLNENKFSIPLTFVITSDAYKNFLERNGLKHKLVQMYHNTDTNDRNALSEQYSQVKRLFLSAELPQGFYEEVMESYHSLGFKIGSNPENMIQSKKDPSVIVFKSPNYLIDETDFSGIFMNVKGEEVLLKAILAAWASLFSPESVVYRKEHNIKFPDNCAVLVQQFCTEGSTARIEAETKKLFVESYYGMPDLHKELNKDHHVLDREYLHILESEINYQEYKIDISEGRLIRRRLQKLGSEQKLNDKEVMESGRLTKRSSQYVGKNLVLWINFHNNCINILLANRRSKEEPVYEQPSQEEVEKINNINEEIEQFENQEVTEETKEEINFENIELPEPVFSEPEEVKVQTYEEPVKEPFIQPPKEVVQETETPFDELEWPEDKKEEVTEETKQEDFIVPTEEFIQVGTEPKPSFKGKEIFRSAEYDASSVVVKIDHAIYDSLKRKYQQMFDRQVTNFYQLIEELKTKMHIPGIESVKKVRKLRDEFLEEGKLLTAEEIKFVLETGKNFFNEIR